MRETGTETGIEAKLFEFDVLKGSVDEVEEEENGSDTEAANGSDLEIEKGVENGSSLTLVAVNAFLKLGVKVSLLLGVKTPAPFPVEIEVEVEVDMFCLGGGGSV